MPITMGEPSHGAHALRWFNRARLRRHAVLLALVMWSLYAYNIATPGLRDRFGHLKATDFLQFYVAGSLVAEHRAAELYDLSAFVKEGETRVPQSKGVFFLPIYGPQVAAFFAPFAGLSYSEAAILWAAITTLMYAACCYALWRNCPKLRGEASTVFLLALALPAFYNLLIHGQISVLPLILVCAAYLALRQGHPGWAGVAIGALVFKPQLGIAAACVFLLNREWWVVWGAVLSAVAEVGLAWMAFGTHVTLNYWRLLLKLPSIDPILQPKLYQMHSLRSFWQALVPWSQPAFLLYALSAVAVIAVAVLVWHSSASLKIRYAVLVLSTVLVAPHLFVYDLVLLVPVFFFVGEWLLESHDRNVAVLLYVTYWCPLLGMISRITRVQFPVLIMSALLLAFAFRGARLQTAFDRLRWRALQQDDSIA